ncbi:MAG: acyl-CoA dehydrogenase family protein [Alphaproteobacteria bacterium]|nr:acyl-CoA dehydrogenase family protein [Alphaproteobacteria bacterium]
MARNFAVEEMQPHAALWDKEKFFPVECLKKAATLGLAGIYVQEDIGGAGLDRQTAVLIFEELSSGCVSTAAYLSIHNMVCWMIDTAGNDQQRSTWLPSMLTMDRLGSYCLTEPGSGSDAGSLSTQARLVGDDYVLDGTKAFISGGGTSDVYVVMARTGAAGPKGVSAFIVEKGTPGLSFGKSEHKLGWNSQPTSMVFMENCKIPVRNRLGVEGSGFKLAMRGLDGGRLNIGACSVGGARFCLEMTSQYMKERKQFNQPLTSFQALQFRLADMATELEASRLMLRKAAFMLDNKHPDATVHCAMAKRFATDTGFKICDEALQLHGGYGYLQDFPVERYLRDTRVHRILEGTNEIMRVIIARHLLAE